MSKNLHDDATLRAKAAKKRSSGFLPSKNVLSNKSKKAQRRKAREKKPTSRPQTGDKVHSEPQQQQQQQQQQRQQQQQQQPVPTKRSVDKVSKSIGLPDAADAANEAHPLRSEATPLAGLTMFSAGAAAAAAAAAVADASSSSSSSSSPVHKRVARVLDEPGLGDSGVAAFSLSRAEVADIAQDFVHPPGAAVGGWSDYVFECDAAPHWGTAATLQRILDTLSDEMNCGPRIFRGRKEIQVEMLRQRCQRAAVVLRLRLTKSGGLECAMARSSGSEEAAFDLLMDLQQLSGLNKRGSEMRRKRATSEPLALACCAKDSSSGGGGCGGGSSSSSSDKEVDPADAASLIYVPRIVVEDVVSSICAADPYFTLRAVDAARQFAQAACFVNNSSNIICPVPLAYLGSLHRLVAVLPRYIAAADENWEPAAEPHQHVVGSNPHHEVVLSLFVGLALLAEAAGHNELLGEDMVQSLSDRVVGPMLRFCELHDRDVVGSREVLAHVPSLVNAHPTLRKNWLTRAVATCNICKQQQPPLQRTAEQARKKLLTGPGETRRRMWDARGRRRV